MFGFFGRHKRARTLRGFAPGLPATLASMHPVDLATVLLLANDTLDLLSRLRGRAVVDDPAAAGTKACEAALDDILPVRDGLAVMAADETDQRRRHAVCQLCAIELVAITVGLGTDPSLRGPVVASWRAVWGARGRLVEALRWVYRHERETGVVALHPGRGGARRSDPETLRLATRVPAFLRRKPSQPAATSEG